jgi:pimeloyl-ACP methyl ester carboxylesterase
MAFTMIGPGRIEYERIGRGTPGTPAIVMLHEGLGSLTMWKDFPAQLARATSSEVVVYSRHGYGRSEPIRAPRAAGYMHHEALTTLPQFLDALQIEAPILFGHSDGASIALVHAGGSGRSVAGIVALAPHIFVEELSIAGIAAAKVAFETANLRERLSRYHDDAESTFWGWNNVWLTPAFWSWTIEEYLPRIGCPVLAVQGKGDEYGTMEQIERIARAAPDVTLLKLENCGHSPHRDRPDAVLGAVVEWLQNVRSGQTAAPST